jgi:hypothetical protein
LEVTPSSMKALPACNPANRDACRQRREARDIVGAYERAHG